MTEGGRGVALETASMTELEAQVRVCQLCPLAKTRTKAVPGEGDVRAEVMFIGEGPGYHEDKQGRPFVGAAGQFLNELLHLAGLDRQSVYITNVVKCRPPNNRDPEPEEKAACAPYLERQMDLINPLVIVTLGRHSMARFFPGELISRIHGTARLVDGRLCVAMYHPAAGLHQASLADIIRADFRKLPVFVEQARIMLLRDTPPAEELGAPVLSTEYRVPSEPAPHPRPPAGDTEPAEAEAAHEHVIREPATAAVLASDLAGADELEAGAEELETADELHFPDTEEPPGASRSPESVGAVREPPVLSPESPGPDFGLGTLDSGLPEGPEEPDSDDDFKQLSFFP